jgi:hypothetical protein
MGNFTTNVSPTGAVTGTYESGAGVGQINDEYSAPLADRQPSNGRSEAPPVSPSPANSIDKPALPPVKDDTIFAMDGFTSELAETILLVTNLLVQVKTAEKGILAQSQHLKRIHEKVEKNFIEAQKKIEEKQKEDGWKKFFDMLAGIFSAIGAILGVVMAAAATAATAGAAAPALVLAVVSAIQTITNVSLSMAGKPPADATTGITLAIREILKSVGFSEKDAKELASIVTFALIAVLTVGIPPGMGLGLGAIPFCQEGISDFVKLMLEKYVEDPEERERLGTMLGIIVMVLAVIAMIAMSCAAGGSPGSSGDKLADASKAGAKLGEAGAKALNEVDDVANTAAKASVQVTGKSSGDGVQVAGAAGKAADATDKAAQSGGDINAIVRQLTEISLKYGLYINITVAAIGAVTKIGRGYISIVIAGLRLDISTANSERSTLQGSEEVIESMSEFYAQLVQDLQQIMEEVIDKFCERSESTVQMNKRISENFAISAHG